jgi:transcriptional/translational regulatory protein YebC/TACO1
MGGDIEFESFGKPVMPKETVRKFLAVRIAALYEIVDEFVPEADRAAARDYIDASMTEVLDRFEKAGAETQGRQLLLSPDVSRSVLESIAQEEMEKLFRRLEESEE